MSVYADNNIMSRSFSGELAALGSTLQTRLENVFRRPLRRFIISFERDTIDIRPRRSRFARQRQRFFSFTIATAQHRPRCSRRHDERIRYVSNRVYLGTYNYYCVYYFSK